jgi:hypothetical protein
MNTPLPKPDRVRVTVPVTGEVLEAFQKIAQATGMSVGRCMGEWLQDTLDAAQFMGQTVEKARAAPKLVAKELHAYALGLGDMTRDLLDEIAEKGRAPGGRTDAAAPPARPATGPTPPSNTGVTTTPKKTRKGGNGV